MATARLACSFSFLIAPSYVPITINDAPRFPWRSVLLDSARHFLPVPVVLRQLDAMAWNKFKYALLPFLFPLFS